MAAICSCWKAGVHYQKNGLSLNSFAARGLRCINLLPAEDGMGASLRMTGRMGSYNSISSAEASAAARSSSPLEMCGVGNGESHGALNTARAVSETLWLQISSWSAILHSQESRGRGNLLPSCLSLLRVWTAGTCSDMLALRAALPGNAQP